MTSRARTTAVRTTADADRLFLSVALLLFSSGWAANHFASMLPVLRGEEHLTSVIVNGAFGIYAIGLLPGLLGGGGLADRIGPRRVVVSGAAIAASGNLVMALWHTASGILPGRLIVGLGVGLAVSAGTAWAANLRGLSGATLAGVILTAGFAAGPLASGALALVLPPAARLTVPFVVTALLSVLAVVGAVRSRRGLPAVGPSAGEPSGSGPATGEPIAAPEPGSVSTLPVRVSTPPVRVRRVGRALAAALPMALWVFSCATVAFVVLPSRMAVPQGVSAILPGVAAGLGFGTGLALQMVARRRKWGPFAGVGGAALAALGFALVAAGGQTPPVPLAVAAILVLGSAYGLCLREGLTDVDLLAPRASRGIVIGVFYAFTYLGFGLPLLLETLRPTLGPSLPLFVLAALALAASVTRAVHVLSTDHLVRAV